MLDGDRVHLRAPTGADVDDLVRIRCTPQVYAWWRGGDDLATAVAEDLAEPGTASVIGHHRLTERGPDGTRHDSLLMDLLADEITPG
jgi:hypothetical protein